MDHVEFHDWNKEKTENEEYGKSKTGQWDAIAANVTAKTGRVGDATQRLSEFIRSNLRIKTFVRQHCIYKKSPHIVGLRLKT